LLRTEKPGWRGVPLYPGVGALRGGIRILG
jgi:hypothetical protein